MTERLYYTDSYCMEFDSPIQALAIVNGGSIVRLQETFFYPTSGGQAHDLGTLNGWPVVDVTVAEDGGIDHIVDAEIDGALVGTNAHGQIDRTRRYDLMQQHSGQHLLSQAFYSVLGHETISVHFGDALSTLDLDVPEVTTEALDKVERFANKQIYAALPIKAYFVDDGELQKIPMRKPPVVKGRIRIVEIDRFDYSACGGTHVCSTAELGLLKLLRQEKRKRGTRITFVCGGRALRDYSYRSELLATAAEQFSTDVAEVPSLIARLQAQLKNAERQVGDLSSRMAGYEAAELLAAAQMINAVGVVTALFDDRELQSVKNLANHLREQPATVGLLVHIQNEKLSAIFTRSDDLPLHMGNLLRDTLKQFDGGGGGRPEMAQGGGIAVNHAQSVLDTALTNVTQLLTSGESTS